MKEIEIGEYVRTNQGIIFTYDQNFAQDLQMQDMSFYNDGKIIKHSKNIMELIQEGDLIKFEYNNDIYIEEVIRFDIGYVYFLEVCFSPEDGIGYDLCISNKDIVIKSIVTKEQFESVAYTVE